MKQQGLDYFCLEGMYTTKWICEDLKSKGKPAYVFYSETDMSRAAIRSDLVSKGMAYDVDPPLIAIMAPFNIIIAEPGITYAKFLNDVRRECNKTPPSIN